MPKIRNIVVLLLLIGGFWHFYGTALTDSGFRGVMEEIRSDVEDIQENPQVIAAAETVSREVRLLFGQLEERIGNNENPSQPTPDSPELEAPSGQSFSVHNAEIGDSRETIEEETGEPERVSLNEYGVEWAAYHEDYHNFFMAAYNEENEVIGLYTNQDLISSTEDIGIDSSKSSVREALGEPLDSIQKGMVRYQVQNDGGYDVFQIDGTYVTVFYDKHEDDTVTAIQIISKSMEDRKENFFAAPGEDLREGLEYQLFDLTNAARVVHDLPVLSWHEAASETAYAHSRDMAENNYFGHTNLQGQTPFDRLKEDGIAYRGAGENLAAGQPSSIFAHEGLMNSLGHRKNILHSDFEALGVGVAFGTNNQPFYTENFLFD